MEACYRWRWERLLGECASCCCSGCAGDPLDRPGAGGVGRRIRGGPFRFGLEARANYRDSEENRFPVPFPFDAPMLPVGQMKGFEETVDAGSHVEISNVALLATAGWRDLFTAHGKLDLIDLYDRNPTSTGERSTSTRPGSASAASPSPALLAPRSGVYLKIGKIPKFERQDDRHLESYGLVSTAFNRFEDDRRRAGPRPRPALLSARPRATARQSGLPARSQRAGRRQRHPGAPAAGRTRTRRSRAASSSSTTPEVEDFDARRQAGDGRRGGLAPGGRGGAQRSRRARLGNRRKLARRRWRSTAPSTAATSTSSTRRLRTAPAIFAVTDDDKREAGGNVWLYLGGFSFFGQYVDQKLAGLPRTGIEGEVAWRFDLPLVWAVRGRQLFPSIAPAVRYSKLDNSFRSPSQTPSPSFAWDWEKIDAGLRLGIFTGTRPHRGVRRQPLHPGLGRETEEQRVSGDAGVEAAR